MLRPLSTKFSSNFTYNYVTQRDLQYQVDITDSPIKWKSFMGFNFSVAGFRIYMSR